MKINFLGLLTILFIGLKLTNYIGWSWWLVLLPLYIWPAIVCISAAIMFFIAGLIAIKDDIKMKYKQ